MTAFIRSEAMRHVAEAILIDSFEYHFHDFLHQFIPESRYAERTHLPVLFGNIRSSCRHRLIGFLFQFLYQLFDFFQARSVNAFSVRTFGRIALLF